ncbi:hypothetical protein FRC08_012832 [Ceratobasidium sp. 394]|nr:hypothetical protein FRC08_012832 [Ceratobasidium sp. 394]KAG9086137.1 hypothetical protein FS749_003880 [Ceratobasidium sp. UAMH 11750]
MKFLAILSLLTASVSAVAIDARSGHKMTQKEAEDTLRPYGIKAASSGNCTKKNNAKCTSYDGILSGTIYGVILLYITSECPVTITGGTEVGHAPGTYSHANGYKVNLRKNPCLNKYLHKFVKPGKCGKDLDGNLYCELGNNWDVTYY